MVKFSQASICVSQAAYFSIVQYPPARHVSCLWAHLPESSSYCKIPTVRDRSPRLGGGFYFAVNDEVFTTESSIRG